MMLKSGIALASLTKVAIGAKDVVTPAPKPIFDTNLANYELVKNPSVLEVGSFPLIVTRAAWNIFDQREQVDILDWVDMQIKDRAFDPQWADFGSFAPNGYCLQSVVLLDQDLDVGDFLVSALVYPDTPD